jgi:hypothetical protein
MLLCSSTCCESGGLEVWSIAKSSLAPALASCGQGLSPPSLSKLSTALGPPVSWRGWALSVARARRQAGRSPATWRRLLETFTKGSQPQCESTMFLVSLNSFSLFALFPHL